ncbi:MAG TPA: glycosyltransferase family 4 protein [Gammaproteobacteria bacterium]|nr:glycosyltransferase family 4 protein [Gammaproteobacteria bacterium]
MGLTIVQVLPALEMGGVERGTVEVAHELCRRGHRAIVISAGGRLEGQLRQAGAEHLTWPIGTKSPLTFRFVPRLRRLFRQERVDIVHARSRLPAWVAHFALRGMMAARPAFVTTVHGPYSVSRYSAIMTRGDRVIAISRWIEQYIKTNYPKVDPEKIRVIPRGVDPKIFRHGYLPDAAWCAEFEQAFPQTRGKQLLTLPGRLSRRKGQQDFLSLLRALTQRRLPVHGLIVGGAHPRRAAYVRELQDAIHDLNLASQVTMTGPRNDLREIMAISRIVFNLSTEPEGFGRTTLEALSLGVPVIGYAHSGTAELLSELYPTGLVPTGHQDELLARATQLLNAPPPVPASHPYTLQTMLDATLDVYQSLARV